MEKLRRHSKTLIILGGEAKRLILKRQKQSNYEYETIQAKSR